MVGDSSVSYLGLHFPFVWTGNSKPIYSRTFGIDSSEEGAFGYGHMTITKSKLFKNYIIDILNNKIASTAVPFETIDDLIDNTIVLQKR